MVAGGFQGNTLVLFCQQLIFLYMVKSVNIQVKYSNKGFLPNSSS